jgi:hypothetical protein
MGILSLFWWIAVEELQEGCTLLVGFWHFHLGVLEVAGTQSLPGHFIPEREWEGRVEPWLQPPAAVCSLLRMGSKQVGLSQGETPY